MGALQDYRGVEILQVQNKLKATLFGVREAVTGMFEIQLENHITHVTSVIVIRSVNILAEID